jgi:carboxymethylenebutenolidase
MAVKKARRSRRAGSRTASSRRPRKRARRAPREARKQIRAGQAPGGLAEAATPAADDSYLALPRLRSGPGVLVLHAWWGLNPFIRTLCDRLAREGFVVLAPDLYHGRIASTIEEAESRMSGLKWEMVQSEVLRAVDKLRSLSATKSVGVVGLSLGASWSLWLSCTRPEAVSAVVTFYGAETLNYGEARAAFQCHFAAEDPYVLPDGRQHFEDRLRSSGRQFEIHDYPGTHHWFFEEDRPEAYDKGAASLAWRRTLGFLRDHLTP